MPRRYKIYVVFLFIIAKKRKSGDVVFYYFFKLHYLRGLNDSLNDDERISCCYQKSACHKYFDVFGKDCGR